MRVRCGVAHLSRAGSPEARTANQLLQRLRQRDAEGRKPISSFSKISAWRHWTPAPVTICSKSWKSVMAADR